MPATSVSCKGIKRRSITVQKRYGDNTAEVEMARCSLKVIVALVLVSFVCSSALAYKKIKTFMPQVPELDLQGVRKIAILDFTPGNAGSQEAGKFIADKIIEYTLGEDRGIRKIEGGLFRSDVEAKTMIEGLSTRCFSVVERSRLESVLSEQSMSAEGLVDDAQATEIGQLLGVDVLIYGDVSQSNQDTRGYEKRRYNNRDYQVTCVNRKVTVSANMRVVDTRSGEILGTRRSSRTSADKVCEGDNRDLKSYGQLAGYCANGLAWEFTNMFNPWYAVGEFELDKIKADEFKDEAKDAAEAAEDLELDKAYAIYNKLYQADPYNPKCLYNMGVLYEVAGSFDKAKEMYEGAAMLKDEDHYKEAAERIGRRAQLIPFYASLDMAIVPLDFEAAAADKSLLATKVEV
ncbi:hypothetical protein GF356_01190, partial [candidate division GN15 bacterium]|nr:hypothetical protein [candidate division GN15 bacterium]